MKKLLYLVSFVICSMLFCFVPQISVYAVGDSWTDAQKYSYFQNNFDDINTRLNGVIINQNRLEEAFEDYLQEYRDNYNIPSGTTTSDWISNQMNMNYQNGSNGNADIEISQALREAMRDWVNAYIETNTGFIYGYSVGSARFLSYFNDQNMYHAFLDFISENDSSIILFTPSNTQYIYVIEPLSDPFQFVLKSDVLSYYTASIYSNWQSVTSIKEYSYDSSNSSYTFYRNNSLSDSFPPAFIKGNEYSLVNDPHSLIVDLNSEKYIIYKSFESMRAGSEGVQQYYTVSGSYNDTISGSYNTTTNNVNNTLTSSDVNNYINNYYVENGSYPTPNQVNVYITNNIDNNGGSGGGSGGDNGGGSDNSNIWDFLDSIGDFIGHLISSLGEVLSGILSLLTDVIDLFIGDEGLPNVFSQLVSYYLGFLPEEFLRLIELFIVCVLIVGVIKLIRGS